MNAHKESRSETYDVIVIGSGMGGLTAAALLAKAGKKVLVVERHDRPGGYAQAFQRQEYHFDAAVHLIGGCDRNSSKQQGMIDSVMRALNVRDRCNFIRVNPWYTAIFPNFRFQAPLGVDAFTEAHVKLFPREEKGLRELMQLVVQADKEMRQYPTHFSFLDAIKMPMRFPALFKYHNATLDVVMDTHITNPHLKALLSASWLYPGLPPSRTSFLLWAMEMIGNVAEGAFYCQGTFQNMANAFVEALKTNGGELLLQSPVQRILIKNGEAKGVILENKQRIYAPIVISNADATQTFERMVGVDYLPERYVTHLRRMKPSLAAFVLYLATNLDLPKMGASHEMFVYNSWDHDQTYSQILAGQPSGMVICVPTLVDPSLAPQGEHIVSVTTLIPHDIGASWQQEKQRYAELLLDEVEKVFPGLRQHMTFAEGAFSRTTERYALNLTGPIYGWETSPAQMGDKRLEHKTPIGGLYLAGHWTQPGLGISGVVNSGARTVATVLGYANETDLLEAVQLVTA